MQLNNIFCLLLIVHEDQIHLGRFCACVIYLFWKFLKIWYGAYKTWANHALREKLRENENSGKILGEDSWVGWNYSQSPSVHCNSVFDVFVLENISVWALRGHWTPTLPPYPHNPIFFGTRNILNSLFWLVLALFLYTESLRINFLGYSISVCP